MVMAVDLQRLAQVLEASLDPSKNKQGLFYTFPSLTITGIDSIAAELAILQEEKKPNFSLSLLQVVASDKYGGTARLASALYFKNHIKRHWTVNKHLSRGRDETR